MTVAKRAVKEIRGARSKAQVVPGTVSDDFARFQGVLISPPHSELGGLVSPEYIAELHAALKQHLRTREDAPFPGGKPILEIDPQVHWYQSAGGLGGLMGSDSFAVVLFKLRGAGADLGSVQVVTKDAALHVHERGMAESTSKALAKWFRKIRDEVSSED